VSTIIATIDHFTGTALPMLRLIDGTLVAGDADVRALGADVGDVVIRGDGWEKGSQADWEPRTEVGVVEHVTGTSAFVRTALGLTKRTIPGRLQVEPGNTVTFDARPELLAIATTKPLRPSLFGDDFDVASVRSAPDPGLDWTAFAGFPGILREAQEIVAVHTDLSARTKLRDLGVAPVRGILFEGPPGTGKTFLAQIMAAQSHATFYLITTASLGGRLVSESEQRLEAIYADAAKQEMSIMFIDEIEVLTKDRGSEQEHGSRLVNVFLTNMDGVVAPDNVITIGTTNRVDDIDKALRRPGRFDREVTFRHPNREDRLAIIVARPHRTAGDIGYEEVADATDGWTAAELGAIWQHAGELTVIASRDAIHNDHFLMGFERARAARANRLNGA
jgi:transitional endoplasmic reticulum ATPase